MCGYVVICRPYAHHASEVAYSCISETKQSRRDLENTDKGWESSRRVAMK